MSDSLEGRPNIFIASETEFTNIVILTSFFPSSTNVVGSRAASGSSRSGRTETEISARSPLSMAPRGCRQNEAAGCCRQTSASSRFRFEVQEADRGLADIVAPDFDEVGIARLTLPQRMR